MQRPRTRSAAARQVSNTHERDLVTHENKNVHKGLISATLAKTKKHVMKEKKINIDIEKSRNHANHAGAAADLVRGCCVAKFRVHPPM